MKKILSIALAVILVSTSSLSIVFASQKSTKNVPDSNLHSTKEKLQNFKDENVGNSTHKSVYGEVYKEQPSNLIEQFREVKKEVKKEIKEDRKEDLKDLRTERKDIRQQLNDYLKELKDESVRYSTYKSVYSEVYKDQISDLISQSKIAKMQYKEKKKAYIRKIVQLKKESNENNIPVFANGSEVKFDDVSPIIKEEHALIPVKSIVTALGADVDWDPDTKTVSVLKSVYSEVYGTQTTVISLKIGSDIIKVNGLEVKIDVPAQIHNGRTVVPIKFIAQVLGKDVEWDSVSGSIIIDD